MRTACDSRLVSMFSRNFSRTRGTVRRQCYNRTELDRIAAKGRGASRLSESMRGRSVGGGVRRRWTVHLGVGERNPLPTGANRTGRSNGSACRALGAENARVGTGAWKNQREPAALVSTKCSATATLGKRRTRSSFIGIRNVRASGGAMACGNRNHPGRVHYRRNPRWFGGTAAGCRNAGVASGTTRVDGLGLGARVCRRVSAPVTGR